MIAAVHEVPLAFACGADTLVGVLHPPSQPSSLGVVIVVGGPQYRAGSHRQFVLLARHLAAAGMAALRFDCRGMGDSDGDFPGFEAIGPDIEAAVDALAGATPAVTKFVLWGLCDGASAICSYAAGDARIAGIVLVNPWARSEATQARTYLKHYYRQRLLEPAFLRKILTGGFNPFVAGRSLWGNFARALGFTTEPPAVRGSAVADSLIERMAFGCGRFRGPSLLILSGRDLTAKEFADAAAGSARWRGIFENGRLRRRDLAAADHTFSRRDWLNDLLHWTEEWILADVQSDPDRASR
jgi:uncharacterized protein